MFATPWLVFFTSADKDFQAYCSNICFIKIRSKHNNNTLLSVHTKIFYETDLKMPQMHYFLHFISRDKISLLLLNAIRTA